MKTLREKVDQAKKVQKLLTKAFQVLRKRFRMVARQRYMCCNGCAGSALAEEMRGKLDPQTFGGVVLTTKQSGVFVEPGTKLGSTARIHDVRLTYGPLGIDGKKFGPDAKTVGDRIAEVFDELGVPYEWDGDPEVSIKVVPLA